MTKDKNGREHGDLILRLRGIGKQFGAVTDFLKNTVLQ